MSRSVLLLIVLLWPIAAHAESGPVPDSGVPHGCVCNDDCGAGEVCVVGTRGARACCPGSGLEDCPAEPGPGIMCVDAGPLPDSGVDGGFDAGSFDAGGSGTDAGSTPATPPEDDGCSAGGSIAGGALAWVIALVAAAARRRRR